MVRSTHTYVTLPVSAATHAEVKRKLEVAGYDHAIDGDEINMHGLALVHAEPELVADARALAVETWGEAWVANEWESLVKFAQALSGKAPVNEGDHG